MVCKIFTNFADQIVCMTKITKFPSALISGDCTTSSLRLDGGSIIDQCIVTAGERGTFFLEQHLLYVVLGGSVKLTCGRQSWTVGKNEYRVVGEKVGTAWGSGKAIQEREVK